MEAMLSYSFYTNNLNSSKYNLLKEKALIIRDFKNKVSNYIYENKLDNNKYLSKKLSRPSLQKECANMKPKSISIKLFEAAILEVLTMYNNRRQECKKSFKKAVSFTKLTFSNTNVLSKSKHDNIIGKNENSNSSIKFYLKLSSMTDNKGELLNIPIKVSNKYHSELDRFNHSKSNTLQFNISYTVQFVGKNKLRFILTKEGIQPDEVEYESKNPIGIDVNIKHNLLSLSNGFELNHNKKFYNDYLSFLMYLDNKKANKSKYKNKEKLLSKRDASNYNKYLKKLEGIYNENVSSIISYCKDNEFDTIVLENLGSLPKSFAKMDEQFKGFKVSRLAKLMRLSEIKNIFKRLGNKYEIKIVLVNPAYTSQQCEKCNHISKSNRKSQEMFSCVKCGYECNADLNASNNIKNRFVKYNKVNGFKNHKQIKTFFEDLSLNVSG